MAKMRPTVIEVRGAGKHDPKNIGLDGLGLVRRRCTFGSPLAGEAEHVVDSRAMDDETNGAINSKNMRNLARGASTVKKLVPAIGGLLPGRKPRRAFPGGRRRASAPARGGGAAAMSAPAQDNPHGKWVVLVLVATLVVWWLADGGVQVCADALRRLQAPAPAETEEQPAATESPALPQKPAKAKPSQKTASAPASPEVLADGLWWEGRGVVEKVLPDDVSPPRHQRFFLRDDRGRSLFFAHNVDEAPRVPDLREGDVISFRGEWRDNEMGGAMHWTHRASGRRKGGWLERDGVRYE